MKFYFFILSNLVINFRECITHLHLLKICISTNFINFVGNMCLKQNQKQKLYIFNQKNGLFV